MLAKLNDRLAKLGELRASLSEDLQHMEKVAAKSREILESEPQPRTTVGALEASIKKLTSDLKVQTDLKKSGRLEELPALTSRIASGRAKMRLVDAYMSARKKVSSVHEREVAAEAVVEACERLVTALGPGGAKLLAVEEPLKELELSINTHLAEYTVGYEIAIRRTEGFELVVRTPETDGGWISTRGLSTSERLRVGIALQDALSHISGLGFLLVDNFDMLDSENQVTMWAALRRWSEDYGTILVLKTADERPGVMPTRTAYWIDHGQAEVIS